jgi:lipopolysaccharide transport system permease protein
MQTTYHLRIKPTKGVGGIKLSELWAFRGLLAALAIRDVKLRYRQTALGVAWVLLQPILASGILAFVFGIVAGVTKPARSPIFQFVFSGYIGWSLFSSVFSRSGQSLLQHSALITKVFFPRILLPASTVLAALLDFVVVLGFFLVSAILFGPGIGWQIITFPFWIFILLLFGIGFGLVSAALSVRFRDVSHITPVLMQIFFYASPIAYQTANVPEKWRGLFLLNPLATLFDGLRWSLLGEGRIGVWQTVYSLVTAALVVLLGVAIFRHAEREFADVI